MNLRHRQRAAPLHQQAARQAGLAGFWGTTIVAVNMVGCFIARSRTEEAAALIDPLTGGPADRDH